MPKATFCNEGVTVVNNCSKHHSSHSARTQTPDEGRTADPAGEAAAKKVCERHGAERPAEPTHPGGAREDCVGELGEARRGERMRKERRR